MIGLRFEQRPPVVVSDPSRADIACFIGFVARRGQGIPSEVGSWLEERGWALSHNYRGPISQLLDVPVPIETWEVFDSLFAWERRDLDDSGQPGVTYLGAAVRSFFAQGGRKCYVVRVGDPWTMLSRQPDSCDDTEDPRGCRMFQRLRRLIPGYPNSSQVSPVDQASWRGVGHLFGLPDVSFLCLPDLADIVRAEEGLIEILEPEEPPEEQFVECSDPQPALPQDSQARFFRAPHCDETGYQAWATALRLTAHLISYRQQRHEVQLVAAVPVPQEGTRAAGNLLQFLVDNGRGPLAVLPPGGIASAFVQIVYPWVKTPSSFSLPQQIESPDAVLTGILARNALTRGAFRSAAGLHTADVYDVFPSLPRDQMFSVVSDDGSGDSPGHTLTERVSIIGHTPGGLRLLSDVTTSADENYRQANINRLVSIIVRAARRLGEDVMFEASHELLWLRVRDNMRSLLLGLLQAGALRGASPDEAFHVRCDRSTMSQNDIDSGRVIAEVEFNAAFAIEQILVTLAMDEGGQVSLVSNLGSQAGGT